MKRTSNLFRTVLAALFAVALTGLVSAQDQSAQDQ